MKRKIITAIVAFSMIMITGSCSDDYVEIDPKFAIDSDNYFNSEEDYYRALVGAYDLLQSTYQSVIVGEIASDNTLAGGESASDVVGWQQIDLMTHTSNNSNLKQIWDWMFAGVNRAAFILENKDKTDFEGREQIIAEARFLKAYYNFELVKWFGGIPMKGDQRFALGDEKTIPRSSEEAVYQAIEADLIAAIPDLNPIAPQVGRVSKGAAQALLGKVYMYHAGNVEGADQTMLYTQAAAVLQDVIDSNNYSLVQDYGDIWENEGENGPESIFEIQYTDAQGASFDCLQCVEGNVAVGFSGPRNYSGPLYTSGFSFNVPDDEEVANLFEEGDLREDVTLLNMEEWSAETGASYGPGYNDTGYFNRKYIPRTRNANAAGDLNLTNPNNYRAIRYADVLLLAAEAYTRIGNNANGQLYLNQVRERAFGNDAHNINSLTGPELVDAILEERRRELFGEGHRFFDLVRTGRADDEIVGFVAGKNEVFPIPIQEIQFSNNLWQQNPGY